MIYRSDSYHVYREHKQAARDTEQLKTELISERFTVITFSLLGFFQFCSAPSVWNITVRVRVRVGVGVRVRVRVRLWARVRVDGSNLQAVQSKNQYV